MSLILDGTNGLSDVDGSAATPAIRGSDANTGIFFPAADTIAFAEGGVEAMRIDSSGNVGIGTTTPITKFEVDVARSTFSAASEPYSIGVRYNNTGGRFYIGAASASATPDMVFSAATGDERMRITSSGNLLVGTNTATSDANTFLVNSAKHALVIANGATADSTVLLSCIKSGATSSTAQRYVGFGYNGGANGNGAIAGNGDSQATFITLSDERLKENIENLPSQLANVMALRPVEFDYKATGGHQIGFIAQEVQAVYPDLVAEGDDGYLTLAGFDKNTARLIKAIQEQQAIITALTARVEALEGAQA